MTPNPFPINLIIKILRTSVDLNQKEFAQILGHNFPNYVSQLELGRRQPSTDDIQKLAEYFDLPLELFAEGAMKTYEYRFILVKKVFEL